jgi:hypothetical protein
MKLRIPIDAMSDTVRNHLVGGARPLPVIIVSTRRGETAGFSSPPLEDVNDEGTDRNVHMAMTPA